MRDARGLLTLLVVAAMGCGGEDPPPDPRDTGTTPAEAPGPASPDTPPVAGTPETPDAPSAPSGAPSRTPSRTPSGTPAETPSPSAAALPDWTTGIVEWEPADPPRLPTVQALRTARNDGFDRWVLEFPALADVPGYHVEFIDKPLIQCGSGNQIHPVGQAWLEVRVTPAQAHTDEGQPTMEREFDTPALTHGLRVYRTCDFEGHVTVVYALDGARDFRAFHLERPARIVVDVRH